MHENDCSLLKSPDSLLIHTALVRYTVLFRLNNVRID
nr:MAG TPA_asm: hypothetical protein [Caudoviricetes sp.]